MDFDNYEQADEVDKSKAPVGVHIDVEVVVDSNSCRSVLAVADSVAKHIEESLDNEDIELHANATADTFDPDQ